MDYLTVADLIKILDKFDKDTKVQFGSTSEILSDNGLCITDKDILYVKYPSGSRSVYFKTDEYC